MKAPFAWSRSSLPSIAPVCDVTTWPLFQALLVMIRCLKAKEINCNHGPVPMGHKHVTDRNLGPDLDSVSESKERCVCMRQRTVGGKEPQSDKSV